MVIVGGERWLCVCVGGVTGTVGGWSSDCERAVIVREQWSWVIKAKLKCKERDSNVMVLLCLWMADCNVPCCMMDHGVVQCGVMWCDSQVWPCDVARSKTIQCGASCGLVKAVRGGLGGGGRIQKVQQYLHAVRPYTGKLLKETVCLLKGRGDFEALKEQKGEGN